jgi:hypothetical protein
LKEEAEEADDRRGAETQRVGRRTEEAYKHVVPCFRRWKHVPSSSTSSFNLTVSAPLRLNSSSVSSSFPSGHV